MIWTHSQCINCWNSQNPGRQPSKFKEEFRETETCCFCGASTRDGIYVRHDPRGLKHCQCKED